MADVEEDQEWEDGGFLDEDAQTAAGLSFELLVSLCMGDPLETHTPESLAALVNVWNMSRRAYMKTLPGPDPIDFEATVAMLTPTPPMGFAFTEGGPLRGATCSLSWERLPEDIAFSQLKILSMQRLLRDKPEVVYNQQTQIILAAAKAGDPLLLAFLLAPKALGGAEINPAFEPLPEECATLVHAAATTPPLKEIDSLSEEEEGCADIIDMIMEFPATWPLINVPNVHKNNALHLAAFYGHLNILKVLVRCNGDLTLRNQNLGTPFMCAANAGWVQCTQYLASIPGTDFEAVNLHNATAMHCASEDGHVEVVKYLISIGCNVHGRNKHQGTPLLLAAEKGHIDIVKALVEAGADLNAINKHDTTALVYAVSHRFLEVVQYLLDAGTDHSIRTKQEYTALSLAARCDWEPGVSALLKAGADATVPGPDGTTMLETGVSVADDDIFGLLLAAGADPQLRFSSGLLPCEDSEVRRSSTYMTALAEWGGIADATAFHEVLEWAPDRDLLVQDARSAFNRRAWRERRDAIRLYKAVWNEELGDLSTSTAAAAISGAPEPPLSQSNAPEETYAEESNAPEDVDPEAVALVSSA